MSREPRRVFPSCAGCGAVATAGGVYLGSYVAPRRPQYSGALLGFGGAVAAVVLTVGLAGRVILMVCWPERRAMYRLPALEISSAAFLANFFYRTGLAIFYARRVWFDLNDFETWCTFAMLGFAAVRFWRRR